MSDEPETVTAEISADTITEIANSMPATVLAAVKANMKHESHERIKQGKPPLAPLTDREAHALQFGAQLSANLMVRALQDQAEQIGEQT